MRDRLSPVHQAQRSHPTRARGELGDGVDGPQDVGHVREREDPGAIGQEPVEGREIERPLADERDGADPRAAVTRRHLPGHQVRVMLHVRDEDLVARLQRPPDGLGHDRDRIGGPPREHDLLAGRGADEALDAVARDLVELGRLLPQRVDRAMHVRVRGLVVTRHRLDHRPRLLAGGGGVADEARGAHAAVLQRDLHPHAVAAERVDVLGGRRRAGQLTAEARPAPALPDGLAVEGRARDAAHSSSPRAAPTRYAGKRYAISRESRPPWPRAAISALPRASPASSRGSTRSNVVACENIPHVGMPSTGRSCQRARNRRLPGCAGAPCRSMRAPSRVSPPKTGSSGSSALAPATISTSAPSARSALISSATARGEAAAKRTGSSRPPNQSILDRSAPSKRSRCRAARVSRATVPSAAGRNAATVTAPPRAACSTALTVSAPIASGVTFALATVSPRSTG